MNVSMTSIKPPTVAISSPPFRQAYATWRSRGSGVSQASANPALQPLPLHLSAEAHLGNSRWIVAQLRLRGVPSRIHPKQRDQGEENKNQRQECACSHIFSCTRDSSTEKNLILRNSEGSRVSSIV